MQCRHCHQTVLHTWNVCPNCAHVIEKPKSPHKLNLAHQLLTENTPFYERALSFIKLPYWISCSILGLLLLFFHEALKFWKGITLFQDFSWMLGIMSGYVLFLVVFATQKLRYLVTQFISILDLNSDEFYSKYGLKLKRILSDRNLIHYGIAFGLLNISFGLFFGIWYSSWVLYLSLCLQIFVVGFVCGLAIAGISGILQLISTLKAESYFIVHLQDEDQCAGFSKITDLLLIFSGISLSVGILISLYIMSTPWANKENSTVQLTIYLWALFPHVAALSVLMIPVLQIKKILLKLKSHFHTSPGLSH